MLEMSSILRNLYLHQARCQLAALSQPTVAAVGIIEKQPSTSNPLRLRKQKRKEVKQLCFTEATKNSVVSQLIEPHDECPQRPRPRHFIHNRGKHSNTKPKVKPVQSSNPFWNFPLHRRLSIAPQPESVPLRKGHFLWKGMASK